MDAPHPAHVAGSRRRDLLLTLTLLGIVLTPAWLTPRWLSIPWLTAVLLLGAPAVWLSWWHAPWVPTPRAELDRVLRALALQPGQRFVDLGAGDGRLLLWVREATGARCTGIEASPLLWLVARLRVALGGDEGVEVRFGDLYAADLGAFDVLYVWGTAYSVGTARFRELVQRLPPGTRIVSYHTPIPGLEPVAVDREGQRPLWIYVSA